MRLLWFGAEGAPPHPASGYRVQHLLCRHSGARSCASPESITTNRGYGFRACSFNRLSPTEGASRNDVESQQAARGGLDPQIDRSNQEPTCSSISGAAPRFFHSLVKLGPPRHLRGERAIAMEHEQLVRKACEGDEAFTRRPGLHVSRAEALRGCREILDGLHGDLPADGFYFTGRHRRHSQRRSFGLNSTDYPDTTGDRRGAHDRGLPRSRRLAADRQDLRAGGEHGDPPRSRCGLENLA